MRVSVSFNLVRNSDSLKEADNAIASCILESIPTLKKDRCSNSNSNCYPGSHIYCIQTYRQKYISRREYRCSQVQNKVNRKYSRWPAKFAELGKKKFSIPKKMNKTFKFRSIAPPLPTHLYFQMEDYFTDFSRVQFSKGNFQN